MFDLAAVFFLMATIAAIFGFGDVARELSLTVAAVFGVLALLSLAATLTRR